MATIQVPGLVVAQEGTVPGLEDRDEGRGGVPDLENAAAGESEAVVKGLLPKHRRALKTVGNLNQFVCVVLQQILDRLLCIKSDVFVKN